MRVHVCLHAPFEGLAGIEPWLQARKIPYAFTRFFAGDPIPPLETFDWLIVMGGPMSVNDESELPWLTTECELVAASARAGKTIFGICLGAQMISKALGGVVTKNREREIGWFPVSRVESVSTHPFAACFAETFEAFHWHGETFSIPPGGVHFLRSAACENQAFAVGENILGLQLHCEVTALSLEEMLDGDAEGIGTGRYVQSAQEMRAQPERALHMNTLLDRVLSRLAAVTEAKLNRDRVQ